LTFAKHRMLLKSNSPRSTGARRAGFSWFPRACPLRPPFTARWWLRWALTPPSPAPAGRTEVQRSVSPGLRAAPAGPRLRHSSGRPPLLGCCSPRKPGARQGGGAVHLRGLADRSPRQPVSRRLGQFRLPGRSVSVGSSFNLRSGHFGSGRFNDLSHGRRVCSPCLRRSRARARQPTRL